MEERRRFVRLDTRLSVTYQVLPSSQAKQSVTKDIGGGGICVFLSEPLQERTQLRVEIVLPDRPQPITFMGEVVWCEQYDIIGKSQQHRSIMAGVRFLNIKPDDQDAIMQHVILNLQPYSSS